MSIDSKTSTRSSTTTRRQTTRRQVLAGALGATTFAIGGRASAQSTEVFIASTGGLMDRSLEYLF